MAVELIPEDVREFILDNIDSVAQLEGLLLLRNEPANEWTVGAIAQRLYIDAEQAVTILEPLCSRGFLDCRETSPTTYSYQPKTPELASKVERLAETYSKYLVPVTNLIHSKPQTRVQQFADAFKLRRKKK